MKVYLRHALALNYCIKGQRTFCKKHGLSHMDFVRNGIDVSILETINDGHASKLVELVKQEVEENGG